MKTILFTAILSIALTVPSFAQSLQPTEFSKPIKGDYIIGGTLGFNLNSSPNLGLKSRSMNFSIAPSFGKFISEKYLLHGGLGYSFNNSYSSSTNNDFIKSMSHGINLRFGITRFMPISEKLFFTADAFIGTGIGFGKTKSSMFESMNQLRNINATIGIAPGLAYFINSQWMIYSNIGLLNYTISHDSNAKRTTQSVNLNLSANSFKIGVNYIFKGK